jgi:RecB family exonuclease
VHSSLDGPQDVPSPAGIADPRRDSRAAAPQTPGTGRAVGRARLLERAEVRDVVAWMRLLIDPRDAAAAVRALARPPIELRQVDLARVIQIVRRGRLEVVAALASALESTQLPPEARERIQRFLELHRWAAGGLDTMRADLFVARLIERLGLRRRQLLAGEEAAAERLAGLAGLCELAEEFVAGSPRPTARSLAAHLAAAEEGPPREAGAANDGDRRARALAGEPPGQRSQTEQQGESSPAPQLKGLSREDRLEIGRTLEALREEVLGDVARIAGRLGELRLDTELDVAHGVARYVELIKLAALLERPRGEPVEDALQDLNARLRAAVTPLQREILESSPLDELLLGEGAGDGQLRRRAQAMATRGEPTLAAFLPRRGEGLVLSASDVETYRSCPLRYKYARVLKIPTEQTLSQRFGIVVHQVLERFHAAQARGECEQGTLRELLELLEAAWRRAGMGDGAREDELRAKARSALTRYHERLREEPAQPLWFERSFTFSLGPHHVRGRVDRVDRLPDGGFELIDYKTGYAKTAEDLGEDIQLSLYAIAAREAWDLGQTRQAYYYVLDDRKVPVPRDEGEEEWVRSAVLEVGAGILAQDFEPTPSPSVCARCDYRIACPAAESSS